ncbi:MAG: hypothetical protein ACI9G1_002595 [Pirellulaceae bacterium]|jgi:hypothetical protein
MTKQLQAGEKSVSQFRLLELFCIVLFIAFTLAGWSYLGTAGAVFVGMGVFNLCYGVVLVRRLQRDAVKYRGVEILRAMSCFAIGTIALAAFCYWIIRFSTAFGFGWWREIKL